MSELVGEWVRFDENGPLVQPVTLMMIAIERPIPNTGNKRTFMVFIVFLVLFPNPVQFICSCFMMTHPGHAFYGVFTPQSRSA